MSKKHTSGRKSKSKQAKPRTAASSKSGTSKRATSNSIAKTSNSSGEPTNQPLALQANPVGNKTTWWALLATMAVVFVWSYWSVLVDLVGQWNRVQDYSHGFLVIPLAGLFLWLRRDSFPGFAPRIAWLGFSLILVAAALRVAGAYYYLDAFHGWSIPIWGVGFVWIFFGWRAFLWSLPAIAFLIFMVPLPYTVEKMLGLPLQRISTQISLFLLQCLGQPAVAEGTTIVLGTHTLEVARACSGLRIFFGIAAIAYAFILLYKRPVWSSIILIACIVPISLLANSLRIVGTGLMYQMDLSAAGEKVGHDLAGLLMIPVAAAFFALTLKYLDSLFPEVTSVDAGSLVRSQTKRQSVN